MAIKFANGCANKCAEQLAIEYYTAHKDDIQIALQNLAI